MKVAPRQEAKQVVANTLRGQPWDEAALDRVLAKIDSNTGPPMVDASAFLIVQPGTAPSTLAPIAPAIDPLLHLFVEAEKKFVGRIARSDTPTKISLAQLITDDSPQIDELHQGEQKSTEDNDRHTMVAGRAAPPRQWRKRQRAKIPQLTWPHVQHMSEQVGAHAGTMNKRIRARRPKSGSQHADILLINSSGRPQLIASAAHSQKRVAAEINKENQCRDEKWADLCADFKKMGWKLAGAQAGVTAKKGLSAGIAVAVRSHLETGLCAESADLSPVGSDGRLAAAWTRIGPGTRVLIFSAYLWHSEKLSIRNKGVILSAIARARYFGCPGMIGADFQMPPEVLQSHFGTILDEANAYIVAPNEPTHRPEHGTHRVVDYSIVCAAVKQLILDVAVDLAYEVSPHRAVRLTLRTPKSNLLVEEIKRPRAFPIQKPIGCPRAPVVPEWIDGQVEDLRAATRQVGTSANPALVNVTTEQAWPALCRAIECELSRVCDTVDHQGMADAKHSGHGAKISTVKRRIMPMRASAVLGKVPICTHALMWLHNRVNELASLATKLQCGQLSKASVAQWQRIMNKLADGKGLSGVVRRISPLWSREVDRILLHTPFRDGAVLRGIAAVARHDAEERSLQLPPSPLSHGHCTSRSS